MPAQIRNRSAETRIVQHGLVGGARLRRVAPGETFDVVDEAISAYVGKEGSRHPETGEPHWEWVGGTRPPTQSERAPGAAAEPAAVLSYPAPDETPEEATN